MTNQATLREELRSLRKGVGVTLQKLADSPTVMQMLETDDPQTAAWSLVEAVKKLGDGMAAQALIAAYAFGMRDPATLTFRRADFAVTHNKHTDTVEKWENEAIEELVLSMGALALHRAEQAQVHAISAMGTLEGRRFQSMEALLIRVRSESTESRVIDSYYMHNRQEQDSFPALIYRPPKEWLPVHELVIIARFTVGTVAPATAWGGSANNIFELTTRHHGHEFELQQGDGGDEGEIPYFGMTIKNPMPHQYYGLLWEWSI